MLSPEAMAQIAKIRAAIGEANTELIRFDKVLSALEGAAPILSDAIQPDLDAAVAAIGDAANNLLAVLGKVAP